MNTFSQVISTMQKIATDKLTKMLCDRIEKPLEKKFGTQKGKGNQNDCP